MSKDAQIRITERGVTELAGKFNKAEQQLGRMGKTGRRVSSMLTKDIGGLGRQFSGLYAAMGGIGAVAAGKRVLDFDGVLGQLQADMHMSNTEALGLRDQIIDVSTAFKVGKDGVAEAVQVFQDFGGIVPEGRKILGELAETSKATGTPMADLATIAGTLMQTMQMSPENAMKAIASMTSQSIAGQVALRKLAKVLPEVLASGTGYGFTGQRGVDQLGMALQVAGQATGGKAEEARTLVKALLRDLTAQSKKLKGKFKIDVFNKDGTMRDLDEIMKAVLVKTKGQMGGKNGLASIFTADSQTIAAVFGAAFDQATGEFKKGKGGTVANVLGASRGATMKDIESQFSLRVGGVAKEAEQLKGTFAELDAALMTHGKTIIGFLAQDPTKAIAAAGAGFVGVKVLAPLMAKGIGSLLTMGKGGGLGGLASGLGVQKVFVVNMGGGGMGGLGGGGASGGPGIGGWIGGGVAALGIGAGIGTLLDQTFGLSDKLSNAAVGDEQRWAKERARQYEQTEAKRSLTEQAKMYVGMAGKGMDSVGVEGGKRMALTQEAIMQRLMAQSDRLGMSKENQSQMVPVLKEILAQLKQQRITVKNGTGLDRVEVQQSMGAQ